MVVADLTYSNFVLRVVCSAGCSHDDVYEFRRNVFKTERFWIVLEMTGWKGAGTESSLDGLVRSVAVNVSRT